MKEKLDDVLEGVKNVDAEIVKLLIPALQDTVAHVSKENKRLYHLLILCLLIIVTLGVTALFFVYKQNIKYQEFLSQFDFETELIQDTDDNSVINDGINFNR